MKRRKLPDRQEPGRAQFDRRLLLQCAEGHRLGTLKADRLPIKVRILPEISADGDCCGMLRDRARMWFRCPACVRAGLRGAEKRQERRLDPLLAIAAAADTYGPASVSVRLTTPALKAKLRELIPDGDPRREWRRKRFDQLRASCQPVIRTAV